MENKNIALIIGGWYFPKFLYEEVAKVKSPAVYNVDKYCVMHRMPPKQFDDGLMQQLYTHQISSNQTGFLSRFDSELYGGLSPQFNHLDPDSLVTDNTKLPIQYQELLDLNFTVNLTDNKIGDYYFINQWMEIYDVTMYDYVIFMHDDNYPSSEFQNILVDLFEHPQKTEIYLHHLAEWQNRDLFRGINAYVHNETGLLHNCDYIANSAVGNRKTARGSFSIWSRKFMEAIKEFPMEGVTLNRTGQEDTPIGHDQLEDWNNVGHNLQVWVEQNGFMDTTYRLSPYYRISKYLMEGERGLISNINTPINFSEGFNHYKEYYKS